MRDEPRIDDQSEAALESSPADVLELSGTALTEDLALAKLKNRDLSADEIAELTRNTALMKSRKIRIAIASHPHTARRTAMRLIRELFTFELMRFSLMPAAPADLRRVADEHLVSRLASVSLGERISLARRSSAIVAAALLLDKEKRVWQPALENSRLTEVAIVRALQRSAAGPDFVGSVCRHAKWSLRAEIRVALLHNTHTPLARALEFARGIPAVQMRDILHASRLPEKVKDYLRKNLVAAKHEE